MSLQSYVVTAMRTFVILGMKHPVSTAEIITMPYSCWYSWTGHFLVPWDSHRVVEVGIIALREIVLHSRAFHNDICFSLPHQEPWCKCPFPSGL